MSSPGGVMKWLQAYLSTVPQAHVSEVLAFAQHEKWPYKPQTIKSGLHDGRQYWDRVAPATYQIRPEWKLSG